MTEEEKQEQIAIVHKAVDALSEHFDTVQIFVTRHEGEHTVNVESGAGNWFARAGQVREWLLSDSERTREHVRREGDD